MPSANQLNQKEKIPGKPGPKRQSLVTAQGGDIRPIRVAEIEALIDRQNQKCALTGRKLTPASAACTHQVPIALGGDHAIENLAIIDASLVLPTSKLTFSDFVKLCREVVAFADQQK